MTLEDGTELSPALGIGAFAEKTLVAAGQCTKVDPSARAAAAGLLGCGVMAGLGAAMSEPGFYQRDPTQVAAHTRQLAQAQQALDQAYARWAELDG